VGCRRLRVDLRAGGAGALHGLAPVLCALLVLAAPGAVERLLPPLRLGLGFTFPASTGRAGSSRALHMAAQVTIGTRGSPLALAQAYETQRLLRLNSDLPSSLLLAP
jgi:hypothetical protein